MPSSFRRLSCSNLCFAWSVFDAWRRDGRALMMFCARSYLLFLFDRQRRTHTQKKTNTTNTTKASPPTQQPRRRRTLFERRPFRDDHRSNAFCDSEPRRSRPNHHQRTRDDDDESDFDFVTFSSQKNVEFSKIQTSNFFKNSSKKSNVKKKSTQHVKRCPNK